MPAPLFLFCEPVSSRKNECHSLHPGPESQHRRFARGVGARALVGLLSLMGPHGNSLNLTVSTEPPSVPPSGDSGFLWAGNDSLSLAGGTLA